MKPENQEKHDNLEHVENGLLEVPEPAYPPGQGRSKPSGVGGGGISSPSKRAVWRVWEGPGKGFQGSAGHMYCAPLLLFFSNIYMVPPMYPRLSRCMSGNAWLMGGKGVR